MSEMQYPSEQYNQHSQQRTYRFTPEEIKCLQECNREGFYARSMPISVGLSTVTYFAVRNGYLKPSLRYGAIPKMCAAAFTGYFIGKISYQSKCAEKIMALPNSPFGDMLRRQKAARGGGGFSGFSETLSLDQNFTSTGIQSSTSNLEDTTYSSTYFSDVNDPRPMTDSYDTSEFSGSYRENEIQMREDTLPPKPPQFFTTYDELRRQNRDEHEKRLHNTSLQGLSDTNSSSGRNTSGGTFVQRSSQEPRSNTSSYSLYGSNPSHKNIYGDVWDDKTQ